jgi:hypothetical protein
MQRLAENSTCFPALPSHPLRCPPLPNSPPSLPAPPTDRPIQCGATQWCNRLVISLSRFDFWAVFICCCDYNFRFAELLALPSATLAPSATGVASPILDATAPSALSDTAETFIKSVLPTTSTGAIIGGVVGGIVLLLVVLGVVGFFVYKRKIAKSSKSTSDIEAGAASSGGLSATLGKSEAIGNAVLGGCHHPMLHTCYSFRSSIVPSNVGHRYDRRCCRACSRRRPCCRARDRKGAFSQQPCRVAAFGFPQVSCLCRPGDSVRRKGRSGAPQSQDDV